MSTRAKPSSLVGVPIPAFDESPSSWLARAALSQGISMQGLLSHLQLPVPAELDFFIHAKNISVAWEAAGLSSFPLDGANRVLSNLKKIDPQGKLYLLRTEDRIRYRYCAPCLLAQRQKYLPIHWRFKAWQWCPQHFSHMRDACPTCGREIELPANLAHAGMGREGVASLDHCLCCGYRLSRTASEDCSKVELNSLDRWHQLLMRNGRAFLAALYYGYVFADGERKRIQYLKRFQTIIPAELSVWKMAMAASGSDNIAQDDAHLENQEEQ